MNVDVIARIRHSVENEHPTKIVVDADRTISSHAAGESFSFQHVYQQASTNNEIFYNHVEPLLDMFLSGYNTCLMAFGETDSGKGYTLAGDFSMKTGMIPLTISSMFKKLETGEFSVGNGRVAYRCLLRMFEVVEEKVQDILYLPNTANETLTVEESAEEGYSVKAVSSAQINQSVEAITLFREGWTRRHKSQLVSEGHGEIATTFVQLDLQMTSQDSPMPTKSRMTFVDLPGAEKISFNTAHMRLHEGTLASKGIMAFARLVNYLASKPTANRVINYRESVMTKLLQEPLGGNCRTRVIVCLKPQPNLDVLSTTLRTCSQLAQVRNFPLLNDYFSQQLLTQLRAQRLALQSQSQMDLPVEKRGLAVEIKEELRRVHTENVELRDRNEHLMHRLEQMQSKYGNVAHARSDISVQLLECEEEKLKISKALLEMEIENNRLKEQLEAQRFDLTNKIIVLENDIFNISLERDRYFTEAKHAEAVEEERMRLVNEVVDMKRTISDLRKIIEKLTRDNEELSLELLNLTNSKGIMQHQNENVNTLKRVDMGSGNRGNSRQNRAKPEPIDPALFNKDDVHSQYISAEMARMKNRYDEEQRAMKIKIGDLLRQLKQERSNAQERLRQFSETKGQLLMVQSERDHLAEEVNRLQHKLKDLSKEYRERLVHYLQDVAEHVDGHSMKEPGGLRKYVGEMLHDLQKAHEKREEQLSEVAHTARERMKKLAKSHEALVVAYAQIRQQVLEKDDPSLNAGIEVEKFFLPDQDFQTLTEKEVNRLKNKIERLQMQLSTMAHQNTKATGNLMPPATPQEASWETYRRKLREFTHTTQQELEEERAKLMSDNAMLQAQLKDARDYINQHLDVFTQQRRSLPSIQN